jgi:N-methylhydantoinase A
MQFLGQSHVVRVHLESAEPSAQELRERFERVYWNRFKVELPEIRARIVNANCSVIGVCDPVDLEQLIDPAGKGSIAIATGQRAVTFNGSVRDTPIYWRDQLPVDVVIDGPALIEQLDCTILIPPGDRVVGGVDGNLTIHIGAEI